MALGQIYKIHSDFYYVYDGTQSYECKIREVLKKQKERILVGDFVEFDGGVIESIVDRKNYISRPSVANIDQIVIVSALKEPDLNLTQLNRYIALAKYHGIIRLFLSWNRAHLISLGSKNEIAGYILQLTLRGRGQRIANLRISEFLHKAFVRFFSHREI